MLGNSVDNYYLCLRSLGKRARLLKQQTNNITQTMNDSAIFNLIEEERQRQLKGIELIASENFVSEEVMKAMGSCMTNKYAEGYPGKRYYGGCEVVDQSEQLAIDRIKQLFGAE